MRCIRRFHIRTALLLAVPLLCAVSPGQDLTSVKSNLQSLNPEVSATLDSFLDRETAQVCGLRPALWEGLYFVLRGLTVSAASKTTGALMVFCYLVVSPATGLLLSRRFGIALVLTVIAAIVGTLAGLTTSFQWDLPTNPTICAACCVGLVLAAVWSAISGRLVQRHHVHP